MLIPQILVECLLYAKHVLKMRGTEVRKTGKVSALMKLITVAQEKRREGVRAEQRKKSRVVTAEKRIKVRWWMV